MTASLKAAALQKLGYSGREATILSLAALHSGYAFIEIAEGGHSRDRSVPLDEEWMGCPSQRRDTTSAQTTERPSTFLPRRTERLTSRLSQKHSSFSRSVARNRTAECAQTKSKAIDRASIELGGRCRRLRLSSSPTARSAGAIPIVLMPSRPRSWAAMATTGTVQRAMAYLIDELNPRHGDAQAWRMLLTGRFCRG